MQLADKGAHCIRECLRGWLQAKNHAWDAYVNKSFVFNDSYISFAKHYYPACLQNCTAIVGELTEPPNRDVPSPTGHHVNEVVRKR